MGHQSRVEVPSEAKLWTWLDEPLLKSLGRMQAFFDLWVGSLSLSLSREAGDAVGQVDVLAKILRLAFAGHVQTRSRGRT